MAEALDPERLLPVLLPGSELDDDPDVALLDPDDDPEPVEEWLMVLCFEVRLVDLLAGRTEDELVVEAP